MSALDKVKISAVLVGATSASSLARFRVKGSMHPEGLRVVVHWSSAAHDD